MQCVLGHRKTLNLNFDSNTHSADDLVRVEFERLLIDKKSGANRAAGDGGTSRGSVLGRTYKALPEAVRSAMQNVPAIRRIKRAVVGEDGLLAFSRVCMLSFANYLLNKPARYPASADETFRTAASEIARDFVRRGVEGNLDFNEGLSRKQLEAGISRKDRYFEFEGRLLPVRQFLPEVFLQHHGLKLLPREDLEKLRGRNIIDLGAGIGDSAAVLSKYTEGKIYSFEASATTYATLLETIRLNGLSAVTPVQKAVGRTNEKVRFDGLPRDFYFHHRPECPWEIETIGIDRFVGEHNIANVGMMKVDIEGFELEALQGAAETIRRDKPVISVALYHTGKDFFEIPPLLEQLNPAYRFKLCKLNLDFPAMEVTLLAF